MASYLTHAKKIARIHAISWLEMYPGKVETILDLPGKEMLSLVRMEQVGLLSPDTNLIVAERNYDLLMDMQHTITNCNAHRRLICDTDIFEAAKRCSELLGVAEIDAANLDLCCELNPKIQVKLWQFFQRDCLNGAHVSLTVSVQGRGRNSCFGPGDKPTQVCRILGKFGNFTVTDTYKYVNNRVPMLLVMGRVHR